MAASISSLEHFHSGGQSAFGLEPFGNGGTAALELGDILCFKGGSGGLGHVAILREVGRNYVRAIQQNLRRDALDNSSRYSLSTARGNYKVSGAALGASYVCQGWLRKPPAPSLGVISTDGGSVAEKGGVGVSGGPAPALLGVRRAATMHLRFTGYEGRECLLQTSTNLVHWQSAGRFSGKQTGSDLRVVLEPGSSCRFYRIVAPRAGSPVTGFGRRDKSAANRWPQGLWR